MNTLKLIEIVDKADKDYALALVPADTLKKFAELIVQDMLRLLEQYSKDSFPEDTMDNFDKGYLAGLHTAQKAVKKHFGVEE